MSDQRKGILSAVVIVACLALIGFLVWMKVDGAAVAAIAAVTTLIAWMTRVPDKRDGANLFPLVAAGALVAAMSVACTRQQAVDVAHVVSDMACVVAQAELNDEAIKEACGLSDKAFDDLRPALAEQRRAVTVVATKRAGTKPDAGACP